jgi:transposase
MAAWRRAIELSLGDADTEKLRSIAQSRSEPASRVERARILLSYREDPSFFAVSRALGLHHQTVQRCVERAVAEGPLAALDDRPRPGRAPTITLEAKAWLVSLACRKAKDLGYPHELWTTRLLAHHAREHGPAHGHACLANLRPERDGRVKWALMPRRQARRSDEYQAGRSARRASASCSDFDNASNVEPFGP